MKSNRGMFFRDRRHKKQFKIQETQKRCSICGKSGKNLKNVENLENIISSKEIWKKTFQSKPTKNEFLATLSPGTQDKPIEDLENDFSYRKTFQSYLAVEDRYKFIQTYQTGVRMYSIHRRSVTGLEMTWLRSSTRRRCGKGHERHRKGQ